MFSKIVKPTVNKNWHHRGCSLNVYSTISMNYPPKKFYNINLVIVIPVHFEVRTGSGSFCLLINEVICRSIEPSYHSFFLSLPSIYWSSMSTIKSRLLSFKNESMLALLCSWNNWKVRVGALVQWLWEEGDSCCGFESWDRILDGYFFTYICCKNCDDVCLFERPKIKAHF